MQVGTIRHWGGPHRRPPAGTIMDVTADIRELLDRAKRGSPEAIGQIFEAARAHLLQLADRELPALLRAKISPSDVVQETAVEMHRDFGRFAGTTAEECFAWLRGILRHNLLDAVRHYRDSHKRNVTLEVSLGSEPAPDGSAFVQLDRAPEGSAIRREEAATINVVMARLPVEYRRVLELRYWNGMSFVDMAPQLGRSPDSTRKLWYRAMEQLQLELATAAGAEAMRKPKQA
jgi:RNA polymerase sigma-70 factor (ECF subfamily)